MCLVYEELKEVYKEKTEKFILLNPAYETDEAIAPLFDEPGPRPQAAGAAAGLPASHQNAGEVATERAC